MKRKSSLHWTLSAGLALSLCISIVPSAVRGQVRGVYPPGLNATNSGTMPASGFTYANTVLFYSRDQFVGPEGQIQATGLSSVMLDMNSFILASDKIRALGGARFAVAATLPIAANSLTAGDTSAESGGAGFGDSFYQPLILGWQLSRADLKVFYSFLAPTGKFSAGAANNVGSGYWTQAPAAGQTFFPTSDRRTTISVFEMYELHTTQQGTNIHPGDTFDVDYSLLQAFPLNGEMTIQAGVMGYGQYQTTAKTGPTVTPEQEAARYAVNALGLGGNVILPARRVNLGLKYFKEFSNRSTFQGGSLQVSAAVAF